MRKSSSGNRWHYPKGDPLGRGGQFAPVGTVGAVACESGKTFSESEYKEIVEDIGYQREYENYYSERTDERYLNPPTKEMVQYAERISKASGKPLPQSNTAIAYYDYCAVNRGEIEKPSEKQARAIEKLERESGMEIPHNPHGLSEQHAGAFIGAAKEVIKLKDINNWTVTKDEKTGAIIRSCGHYRVISHKGKYRIEVDIPHKRDKLDKNGKPVLNKNGKVVQQTYYETEVINDDKNYKNPKDAIRAAANHRKEIYEERYKNRISRRRSPATIVGAQKKHFDLEKREKWKENDDGTFTNGQYTIEMGTTGYHAYRTVDYDTVSHEERVTHHRQEWVCTGCATPEEAMQSCVDFNAKAYKREIQPNAINDRELKTYIAKYGDKYNIHSREDYEKFARLNNNSRKTIDQRVRDIGARYSR